jgi:hypothetical protein
MQRTKAPKGASMENSMKISPFGIAMLIAFAVMITAKVFELGIGATLSWWIVTLPLWGPLAVVLSVAGTVFTLVAIGAFVGFIYDAIVNKK